MQRLAIAELEDDARQKLHCRMIERGSPSARESVVGALLDGTSRSYDVPSLTFIIRHKSSQRSSSVRQAVPSEDDYRPTLPPETTEKRTYKCSRLHTQSIRPHGYKEANPSLAFRSHIPSQTRNKEPNDRRHQPKNSSHGKTARNQEAIMSGGTNGGGTSAPPGATPSSVDSTTSSEASATLEEQLLRVVQTVIEDQVRASNRARAQESSSSSSVPSPSRFWRGARKAAMKVLRVRKNSAPSLPSSATRTVEEPSTSTSSGDPGTSHSVPVVAATTGINEQQPVVHARPDFAAMMRTALAKIQEATADDAQGEAAFAEMKQAMTGLMDHSHSKVEPPKLPRDFATKWLSGDADPLHGGAMDNAVILASGYSVDQSYQQWVISQKNTCLETGQSLAHSLTVPNHLLSDMIAAWCLDHSVPHHSTTADTLPSPLIVPSEEQIQDIIDKFLSHSGLQKKDLHLIHLMSKTSKGVHPCLDKWPGLVPVLLNKKKWKFAWEKDVEEERISLFLNLSMHRPNREILAVQKKLPAVLMKVLERADRLGSSASVLAMVASTVAILAEFDVFRERLLGTGGMKRLSDLLKIEDVVVRKETATAILALCTDDEAKSSAVDHDVPEMLLECFMATDEFLLLLDRLPKSPDVLDRICDQAVELVNIVIEEHASGMVSPQGIHSAISLIYIIAQRDVGKLKVKNMEDFKERFRELSSKRIPMQTMFQVEAISKTLSDMF